MNHLYQLTIEQNIFYDTKDFESYIFETQEDAIEYMKMLIETYKQDWMEEFNCESAEQLMREYVEIFDDNTYVNFYIEDHSNTEFFIQEKPILKFR